jgi:4-amino-4-deoxy-L-arabinose transferase-like glycosyltransferase
MPVDVAAPSESPDTTRASPSHAARGRTALLLAAILAVATVLRTAQLATIPPGLSQDEAANAFNAWCLLHTGTDQTGTPWPFLYTRALGENRSALQLYAILPFQAMGGMNVWTTRLPFALAGVLTVLLVFVIARRWFDTPTGLLAAALLATNSWHITLTRFGLEAALAPLLVCLAVGAALWSGIPPLDTRAVRPPWATFLAGLVIGVVCMGYAAVRLFIPPFFALWVLLNFGAFRRVCATRAGRWRLGAFALGLAVTFTPLLYHHLAHPEQIARRAEHLWLWEPDDGVPRRVSKVIHRYLAHFGPDFLFVNGDHFEMQSPQGLGACAWYILPLGLAGLVYAVRRYRGTAGARVLLAWLLIYPAGDCLHRHVVVLGAGGQIDFSLHALRSSPGLVAPLILAALGGVWAFRALRGRAARLSLLAAVAAGLGIVALDLRTIHTYFRVHPRRAEINKQFQVDLWEACSWLKPRYAGADAILVTLRDLNMPYVVMLVGLEVPPEEWFAGPRLQSTTDRGWDIVRRTGKLWFAYESTFLMEVLDALEADPAPNRTYLIFRPGELNLADPAHVIRGSDGAPTMLIFQCDL